MKTVMYFILLNIAFLTTAYSEEKGLKTKTFTQKKISLKSEPIKIKAASGCEVENAKVLDSGKIDKMTSNLRKVANAKTYSGFRYAALDGNCYPVEAGELLPKAVLDSYCASNKYKAVNGNCYPLDRATGELLSGAVLDYYCESGKYKAVNGNCYPLDKATGELLSGAVLETYCSSGKYKAVNGECYPIDKETGTLLSGAVLDYYCN